MQYVALLRGVSGNNPAQRMDKLRRLFEGLGFTRVRTVIASGNVLFETRAVATGPLEAKVERALKPARVSVAIIRTEAEMHRLIAAAPFKGKPDSPSARQNVTFLKAKGAAKLPPGKGYRIVRSTPRETCFTIDLSHNGTPAVMLLLEKAYGKGITTRTWATVLKIGKAFEN